MSLTAIGCDPSSSPEDTGTGIDFDAGNTLDLETFLRDNDVGRLERDAEGVEVGQHTTNAEGVAMFYSPAHQMLFDLSTVERELRMPLADRRIHIAVADTTAMYLITDPTDVDAPFLYTFELPESDAAFEVDAHEQEQMSADPFDPAMDANPFGTSRSPLVAARTESLVAGISVSVSFTNVMQAMAISAVAAVFKYLVDGACNVVSPLYAERCAMIAAIAGTAVELAGGLRTGASLWELGATFLDGAATVGDVHCNHIGRTVIGYTTDPRDDSALLRYREIARRYNYLLHAMETDPQPGQPSWEQMRQWSLALIQLRAVVRNDYFELWNADSVSDRLDVGYGIGLATDAIAAMFSELTVSQQALVLTRLDITDVVRWYLRVGPGGTSFAVQNIRYTRARFDLMQFDTSLNDRGKGLAGLMGDCAANIVQGALVEYYDNAAATMVSDEITTAQLTNGMLEVFEQTVNAIYEENWGAPIPMGSCLPDEYEPNLRWQDAVASPLPVALVEGSVVELNYLNLCDSLGMSGMDEDWYAYNIAPVELRVQARVVGAEPPTPPMPVGQDQPICIDVYFYSQIYEIAGTPPDFITGTCGTVSVGPATDTFGIRRTIGEEWSMILLRVRPGEGAMGPIDYGMRFVP
jgi:hypothetical protein